MVDRVTRFGVSLPSELMGRFDSAISKLGYSNRSKAIGDAVTDFISQKRVPDCGRIIGTVSYIYDHHISDVNRKLVELQHGFEKNIKSTMHSHITHHNCVEVLIVEGNAEEIQKLYGGLSATRGVQNCKLAILDKTL
ncbi:MAG: nickel-responsive transcriptional regulator NikR [Candidatus Altiarchaeota archaeon]